LTIRASITYALTCAANLVLSKVFNALFFSQSLELASTKSLTLLFGGGRLTFLLAAESPAAMSESQHGKADQDTHSPHGERSED
jgi:hypothetical protein